MGRGLIIAIFAAGSVAPLVALVALGRAWAPEEEATHEIARAPEVAPAPVIEAAVDEVEDSEHYLGVVLARRELLLRAARDGVVASISVHVGDTVREGSDLLAFDRVELEKRARGLRLQVTAAQHREEKTDAAMRKSWNQLNRMKKVDRYVTASEMEEARATLRMSVADLGEARARTRQLAEEAALAKHFIDRSILRAKFDGVVSELHVREGETVTGGQVLARIVSERDRDVRFAAPIEDAKRYFREGSAIEVMVAGDIYRGRVTAMAPEIDEVTRSVVCQAQLIFGKRDPVPFIGEEASVRRGESVAEARR